MSEPTVAILKQIRDKALSALKDVSSPDSLEVWRVTYLGRKGLIPEALRNIKNIPDQKKGAVGQAGNQIRQEISKFYEQAKLLIGEVSISKKNDKSANNLTLLPGLPQPGGLHPLTITTQKIQRVFLELGFSLYEGPEIEEEKYNFDNLNIPISHPARAETDTFYIESDEADLLLRTHVSPLQIRAVIKHNLKPPFKYFYYGKSYRNEKTDATHENTFSQFEFMIVHENANLAELKGIIEYVYSHFFRQDIITRFRPGYFPFVEPGFEIDISCMFCNQDGCKVCKKSGWIEVAGAGMVHPNVLKNINVDNTKYRGLALGGSIDRLAMLYYNIDDIRLFWSGNIQFLKQFS